MKRRLLTLTNPAPTQPCAVTHSDAPLTEFRKCVDLGVSSETGLNRVVNEVETDEESLPLNSVDIETASHSASKSLSQKCVQPEAHMQVPTLVPSQSSTFSRDNIEVGGKEKVYITSSEAVNHFYCQLDRDSHLYDKVNEDIAKLSGQPLCADQTLRLNSPCLAKGPDNKWHRGQVTEMSPKLKVHFLDFGDTLIMNESDVRPLPPQASVSLTTPALAIPLGLSGIPTNVPQEVNQWFADHAIGEEFSILVVAIGENGKLIVELFEESVNDMIRKKIAQTKPTRISTYSNQTDLQHDSSKLMTKPNEVPTKTTPRKLSGLNTECSPESGQMNSKSVSVCSNVSMCTYTRPNMDQKKIADAYATCIDGPNYFWCQTNTEDLLTVSVHAEMAEIAQQDVSLGTLKPGSPCLALSSSDNQWYRAQVIQTTDHTLKVLFVDYGNESNVDIGNARPLPESLLKAAPQAFLCSLNGFDESTGSWNDEAYDDFYNLLVDKPLQVAVVCSGTNSELAVPQYAVQIECDGTDINALMQKYWRSSLKEHANDAVAQTETSLHDSQTEGNIPQTVSKENHYTSMMSRKPEESEKLTLTVFASCISEPHFFWCQYSNSENLNKLSELAQEAGRAQQDTEFPETLGPGSPCLALFSSDNRWYRAQVTQRVGDVFHVVFIDYGNEAEVEKKNVRAVPESLLDISPQALLCCLSGFNKSEGSWSDEVYEDFYSLLVDKPLKITLLSVAKQSENSFPQHSVEVDCEGVLVNAALQKYWKPAEEQSLSKEKLPAEDLLQGSQTQSKATQECVSKENVNTGIYKEPRISRNMAVYASCISEPHFFWCQHTNTEDLNKVTELAQEAGQAQQDTRFPETLGPGSPCLALFSSDNRWYRAQVIQRVEGVFHVVFIDYGNEVEVGINSVRSVPQTLLEIAPLAFLCGLNGFEKSKGSWADEVYDDFYSLLVDKTLGVTVHTMEHNSEASVPQYSVDVECEGVAVNTLMSKYWKELDTKETWMENLKPASENQNKTGTMERVGV
ncbi:tudor domain-containing protein 1 [Salarias fasciatus]|uniref:tudor domain-containing protein 1 n=1 Tax=Salarias fasciatus TaxID=181472 RepID=UPI001176DE81|nr:tudor domain-containing protein 1-like [Salarias fasciatus]